MNKSNKKLNLLPCAVKAKQEKRMLTLVGAALGGIIAFAICIQFARIGITSVSINRIIAKNEKYQTEQQKMQYIKDSISGYTKYITAYQEEYFPYSQFMHDLEEYRPDNVHIISADTVDRLRNEGEQSEEDTAKQAGTEETGIKAEENPDESLQNDEKPKYTKDLAGETIILRGYGDTQEDISRYIYLLSNLEYIENVEVTAIEEHRMDTGTYNIFEIKLTGGIFH